MDVLEAEMTDEKVLPTIEEQQALMTVVGGGIAQYDIRGALEQASNNIKAIQDFVADNFEYGSDYGEPFPGSDKPTLLKPGAEKIDLLFNVRPEYTLVSSKEDYETGFAIYHYKCQLINRASIVVMGEGDGSCNSFESKYRWRTGERVCPNCGAPAIFRSKKAGEGWYCWAKKGGCGAQFKNPKEPTIISQEVGRVPNPDIFDAWNTVLKIAQKRSLVNATLSMGVLSKLFTQDAEDFYSGDMPDYPDIPSEPTTKVVTPKPVQKQATSTNNGQSKPKPEPTTPKPPAPQPAATPTPAVTAQPSEDSPMVKELKQELLTKAREANAMVRGDLDLTPEQIQAYIDKNKAQEPPMPEGVPEQQVSELEQFMGKSPTKEEPVKMVKVWDGEKWQEKNASEPIKVSSGNWFALKFVGEGKAFNQYALFGNPAKNNPGHLGKHFGRQNFVAKDSAMTYDQFAALVGYAWYKMGDKEHGYLDPRFYADKIAEEMAKLGESEITPEPVTVTLEALQERALTLGIPANKFESLWQSFRNAVVGEQGSLTNNHLESIWKLLDLVEQKKVAPDDDDTQLTVLVVG